MVDPPQNIFLDRGAAGPEYFLHKILKEAGKTLHGKHYPTNGKLSLIKLYVSLTRGIERGGAEGRYGFPDDTVSENNSDF